MEEQSKKLQIDRHKDVKSVDLEALQKKWIDQNNVAQAYARNRQCIFKMLQKAGHIRDGGFGRVIIVKPLVEVSLRRIKLTSHRIKLTFTDIRPIYTPLYHVRRKARESWKVELKKMLRITSWSQHNRNWRHL